MAARSVVTLTTGPAGSGKTYRRCAHFMLREFLPNSSGVHYSNFPIDVDKLCAEAARTTGRTPEEMRSRVVLLPEEVLKSWLTGESGPWDYFSDKDLSNAHIAIDEIHNFCGRHSTKALKARWQAWLGEIRHRGATVEFLTQNVRKLAEEIKMEAGIRLSMVNSELRRDPLFGIVLGDWYELKGGIITGDYESKIWELEYRCVDDKWVQEQKRVFPLDPFYFQFYDSYAKPVRGGQAGKPDKHVFQRLREKHGRGLSMVLLLWWFYKRNLWAVSSRLGVVAVLLWMFTGGGGALVGVVQKFMAEASKRAGAKYAQPSKVAVSRPSTQPGRVAASGPSKLERMRRLRVAAAVLEGKTGPSESFDELVVRAAEKRAEDLEGKVKELEDKIARSFAVVLITRDSVTFRGGYTYAVGDVVDFGPFVGRRVESIDWTRRSVKLNDGTILRMCN